MIRRVSPDSRFRALCSDVTSPGYMRYDLAESLDRCREFRPDCLSGLLRRRQGQTTRRTAPYLLSIAMMARVRFAVVPVSADCERECPHHPDARQMGELMPASALSHHPRAMIGAGVLMSVCRGSC